MIVRSLQNMVRDGLSEAPVVALLGPRQVGKTTLARVVAEQICDAVYLDLERPSDLDKLMDPELFLGRFQDRLVILDEIQLRPDLFTTLRPLIDAHRIPGRFLILGSASPELLRQSSETLAGRIRFLELSPFLLRELSANDWEPLWLRGGFPDSYLSTDDNQSLIWREQFIRTFLECDIPQTGGRLPPTAMNRLLQMIAHNQGQLWNASKIGSALGLRGTRVRHYLDLFTSAFVIRQLPPLHANLKKRLIKSPKIYLRDSGLLHSLLRLESMEDLYGHPVAGASFEGFVLEQILFVAEQQRWNASFHRTVAGSEIDLVLEKGNRRIGIEIKLSLAPKPDRGYWIAMEDLECTQGFVLYPGQDRYPISETVDVLPVGLVDEIFA